MHLWTLPRDVEPPPPVSRRAIAATIAVLVLAGAVLVALVAPAINRSKLDTAARERSAHAAFVTRERARLVAEQRAHIGRAPAAARRHAARDDVGARAALVAAVRASVGADARARIAAGLLDGPILEVRCDAIGVSARLHVECLAVTGTLVEHGRTTERSGHPFSASGSVRDGRYAWCKENAPPGEGASGTGVIVALPAACTR